MQISSALKPNALLILGLSYAALNLDQCDLYVLQKGILSSFAMLTVVRGKLGLAIKPARVDIFELPHLNNQHE
jgi:hypothetical protein